MIYLICWCDFLSMLFSSYRPDSPDRKPIQYLPGNKAVSIIPQLSSSDMSCAQTKDSATASGNRISVVPTNFLLKSNSLYPQKKSEVSITPAIPEPNFPSGNVQNGTLPLQVLLLNGLQKQQYNNNSNSNNNKSDNSKTCTQNIVDSGKTKIKCFHMLCICECILVI